MYRSLVLATLLVGGSFLVTGCAASSSQAPAPTPTSATTSIDAPAATPTAAPTPHVDKQVVETLTTALQSGNAEVIRPYIGYLPIGCSPQASSAAPVCATNEADGTQTATFYFSKCEGRYLTPAEIQEPLDLMAAMRLDAIYALPAAGQPSGQYSAVLVDQRPETAGQAWEAIIDEAHIVALIFSCTLTPEELVALRHYGPPVQPKLSARRAPPAHACRLPRLRSIVTRDLDGGPDR